MADITLTGSYENVDFGAVLLNENSGVTNVARTSLLFAR
jgi:hypothetical protein